MNTHVCHALKCYECSDYVVDGVTGADYGKECSDPMTKNPVVYGSDAEQPLVNTTLMECTGWNVQETVYCVVQVTCYDQGIVGDFREGRTVSRFCSPKPNFDKKIQPEWTTTTQNYYCSTDGCNDMDTRNTATPSSLAFFCPSGLVECTTVSEQTVCMCTVKDASAALTSSSLVVISCAGITAVVAPLTKVFEIVFDVFVA